MRLPLVLAGVALLAGAPLVGQIQNTYRGTVVTGQLHLMGTTNASQIATQATTTVSSQSGPGATGPEQPKLPASMPLPPVIRTAETRIGHATQMSASGLSVGSSTGAGFDGMTHMDQRLANGGNQFSIEPPSPSIAVSNGMILEGVNNAVRIFGTSGAPLIPAIASNQLFGLAPAIDRTQTPNIYGVYTTDMRVFFDQDTSRWFVLQRAQDEDYAGNPLNQSHIYLAVSQSADPTGTYNIYVMDTTNSGNYGCPCLDDYPQIGADRYGIYISSNEYSIQAPDSPSFNDAVILAISKADLAAGVATPNTDRFILQYYTGYEFAIQPATTPPGATPFLASGGLEFFVSSYSVGFDNNLAVWALSNTASLQGTNPSLLLTQITIPTLPHVPPPGIAQQRSGHLTLGSTLEYLDAGYFSDSRVLSVSYSGGRLFVSLASAVFDQLGNDVAGGLYVIMSPTVRNGILATSSPIKQGYLAATGNNILRPAIAVNPLGRGSIAFTLVGPDYYPSAAFVSIDTTSAAPSSIQIAGAGAAPEDGFSGYGPIAGCPTCSGDGVARWGDYSTAVADGDGTIWSISEYIPNAPRTPLANWGTFISRYVP
jgi:hypothetical protein